MLLSIVKSLFGKKKDAAVPADGSAAHPAGQPPAEAVALDTLDDEELMLRYGRGDVDAFAILVARHEKPLFNFILRSCGRADLAEELLQDVFERVIKSAPRYQKSAKFTTWVYTIARNICIDRARKQSRRTEVSLDAPIKNAEPDGRTLLDGLADLDVHSAAVDRDRAVFRDRLAKALEELPEEQREVFLMREVSGLKFHEIADIVGCPVPTVKSRMRYALETLRGALAVYRDVSFDEDEKVEVVP